MVQLSSLHTHRVKPQNAGEYVRHLRERTPQRTPARAGVIRRFEAWASEAGFETHSPQPQDLVLVRESSLWLVEGQELTADDIADDIHSVIVRLLEYQHFLYRETGLGDPDGLVAVFTEDIGPAFEGFLDSLGIATIWWADARFVASDAARQDGFADLAPA